MSEEVQDSHSGVPDYMSPVAQHKNAFEEGTHPQIDREQNEVSKEDVKRVYRDGLWIDNVDDLVVALETGPCPVCGRTGTLDVKRLRGVHGVSHDNDRVIEMEKEDGYMAVVCSCSKVKGYFVGIATPYACQKYEEWREKEDEIRRFKKSVRRLESTDHPLDMFDSEFTKGVLLAGIFRELGAKSYDLEDLLGRSNIKKSHLVAIYARLQYLDITPKEDLHEEEWTVLGRQGVKGGVEWDTPKWAGHDQLRWSKYLTDEEFDYK